MPRQALAFLFWYKITVHLYLCLGNRLFGINLTDDFHQSHRLRGIASAISYLAFGLRIQTLALEVIVIALIVLNSQIWSCFSWFFALIVLLSFERYFLYTSYKTCFTIRTCCTWVCDCKALGVRNRIDSRKYKECSFIYFY